MPATVDLDALFAMPSFMLGYSDIEDRFSASDGKLYVQFLLNLSLKGEDEGAPSHTTNAHEFGNCMRYLSSNYDDQLT
jgi:hypothetical protein